MRESMGPGKTVATIVVFLVLAAPCVLAAVILALPFALFVGVGGWLFDLLRGVGKRLDDPVFGSIVYEGGSSWSAEYELKAWGGAYRITVNAPRGGPGQAQHELLRGLLDHQEAIREQAQESLFRQYQAVQPRRRKERANRRREAPEIEAGYQEATPRLDDPSQIWTLLSDGAITLEDQPGSFAMAWNCTWDEEHPAEATFVKWKLQEDDD
jgi:hypothetical protein